MPEEGYIVRWDAAAGTGAIRNPSTLTGDLPFLGSDLNLAALQPRQGMAVIFEVEGSGEATRAVDIRPWATSLIEEAPRGRRRRPVFQATGTGDGRLLPATAARAASPDPDRDPNWSSGDVTPPPTLSRPARSASPAPLEPLRSTRPSPLDSRPIVPLSRSLPPPPMWPGALGVGLYLGLIGWGLARGRWPVAAALAAPMLWCASFLAYWYDKHGARTRNTRDREATLHLLDALGGWPGGWVAMQWLRHKQRRNAFLRSFWLIAAVHSLVLAWWVW